MQAVKESNLRSSSFSEKLRLKDTKVRDLMVENRRLVEVPYTASLALTLNALMANRVAAAPVAAPPGHWIGAGGSMIMESDKQTGVIRKQYIGMVTMLDIVAHIGDGDKLDGGDDFDLDKKMSVPVSSIIGHSLEGLSLWTLNPNTSILDCMEVFSKGIHRALVPLDSHMENISGVELMEASSCYRMLTQMDVLKFLKSHPSDLEGVLSRTVSELKAVTDIIFAVTSEAKVIDAVKCMRVASLNALPVVESSPEVEEDHSQLVNGYGRKLVGTISATDLRECSIDRLKACLPLNVIEFTQKVPKGPFKMETERELVTCFLDSRLGEVMENAVDRHVHRVWVVDPAGLIIGLVSLTDMIRVIRAALISEA